MFIFFLLGKQIPNPWTSLSEPVNPDDTQIRVPSDDVINWFDSSNQNSDHKIHAIIATTSHYRSQNETEEVTIVGYDLEETGTDAILTLENPLAYYHSAATECYQASDSTSRCLEYRAEVALLSRNIVFRGLLFQYYRNLAW